jgi:hypothetical protein
VDEDKDGGAWTVLGEGADDGAVGDYVCGEFAGLDVEDEDEDGDRGEDVSALVGEVVFDEAILPIPALAHLPACIPPGSLLLSSQRCLQ